MSSGDRCPPYKQTKKDERNERFQLRQSRLQIEIESTGGREGTLWDCH